MVALRCFSLLRAQGLLLYVIDEGTASGTPPPANEASGVRIWRSTLNPKP